LHWLTAPFFSLDLAIPLCGRDDVESSSFGFGLFWFRRLVPARLQEEEACTSAMLSVADHSSPRLKASVKLGELHGEPLRLFPSGLLMKVEGLVLVLLPFICLQRLSCCGVQRSGALWFKCLLDSGQNHWKFLPRPTNGKLGTSYARRNHGTIPDLATSAKAQPGGPGRMRSLSRDRKTWKRANLINRPDAERSSLLSLCFP